MMFKTSAFLFMLTAATMLADELSPKDVVAQLYQAHRSKHDPLDETPLLSCYFDAALLRLYLKDKREANGEVGRLDGDPLYNAQDIEIETSPFQRRKRPEEKCASRFSLRTSVNRRASYTCSAERPMGGGSAIFATTTAHL
jgi:hypothetical protein